MKLTVSFVSLVVAAGLAHASFPHSNRDLSDVHARHAHLSHRHDLGASIKRRGRSNKQKRCKQRPASSLESSASASEAPAKTTAPPPTSSPSSTPTASPTSQQNSAATSSAAPAQSPVSNSGGNVLQLSFPQCGANGATPNITPTTGPNGAEYFFNCGVDGGGWNPPPITMDDLITVDLGTALNDPNSPFTNCAPYVSLFEQYGTQFGMPAIYLASIAMQESSCNPNQTGGAGEQGLMQITVDKCGAAPNGNCKEPWYNIMTGAQFFSSLLSSNDGNVLLATGMYNGWTKGLTIAQATAAASTSCCTCQNNLDYLTQTLNGWLQNRDPSVSPRIGQYFNLDQCDR